jgi:glyoxylase-like metal-dependent hydrolase (beta-lactamase superfamily II)
MLLLGYEPIPESVSLLGGDQYRFLLEPVTAAVVEYDDGWVLLDSGFNVETVRDPVRRAAHYNFDSYTAIVPPGDPLVDQVARLGLAWDELALCAVSHLHCDHSGGLRLLDDGPPVVLQRREYTFASEEAGPRDAYFPDDYLRPALNVQLIDGDTELAPGLTALATFGHTPGHMSFAVQLAESGTVVLACDAADLHRNITEPVPCGTTTSPHLKSAAAESVRRLHHLNSRVGVQVWPGHDPDFWAGLHTGPRTFR